MKTTLLVFKHPDILRRFLDETSWPASATVHKMNQMSIDGNRRTLYRVIKSMNEAMLLSGLEFDAIGYHDCNPPAQVKQWLQSRVRSAS